MRKEGDGYFIHIWAALKGILGDPQADVNGGGCHINKKNVLRTIKKRKDRLGLGDMKRVLNCMEKE